MAVRGSVVLITSKDCASKLSRQSGSTSDSYSAFVVNGEMSGQRLSYEAGESIAFIHDLARASDNTSIVFAVGKHRWYVVDHLGQEQPRYHISKYEDTFEAIDGFLADCEAAYQESQIPGKQLAQASSVLFNIHADLTRVAIRQVTVVINYVSKNKLNLAVALVLWKQYALLTMFNPHIFFLLLAMN